MRLGVNLGYWGSPQSGRGADAVRTTLDMATTADRLGYDVCWVAEAYGSDAPSVLAWIAGQTSSIGLGSAVMQIPGRTPAMTAMTAATLDMLSQGRFHLGLGVSGPQVSEGWHGVRFDQPLSRTREYVEVVRTALDRRRLTHKGTHYRLPLPDGPGKALHLTIGPVQDRIPVYLAAVGPKNLELTGEIADGWLAIFFSPEQADEHLDRLRAGRSRRDDPDGGQSADNALEDFDVVASVPVVPGSDVAACADTIRAYYALYIGGMGSREKNFYHALATRLGFGEEADTVQDLYLAKRHREAMAAVPVDLIDQTALLGDPARIGKRMRRYADAGVTTLSVMTQPAALELVADAARAQGLLA